MAPGCKSPCAIAKLLLRGVLLACLCGGSVGDSPRLQRAQQHVATHTADYEEDLRAFVSFLSISHRPDLHPRLLEAADWVGACLQRAGLQGARLLHPGPEEETEHHVPFGSGSVLASQPAVYAEWLAAPEGTPTVLIYGHYDVQGVWRETEHLWKYPAFTLNKEAGRYLGRGVDDNKGNLLLAIQAVEAYLATSQALPVNVKFLIEGAEEIGSPGLEALVARHRALLACDLALSTDGGQLSATQGGLNLGINGRASALVTARTLSHDVHAGFMGGVVRSALGALLEFLGTLQHKDGSSAVEGLYRGAEELSPELRADAAAFPFDAAAAAREAGAAEPWGEVGFAPLERMWGRPAVGVGGVWGGATHDRLSSIIPAEAYARLGVRVVAGQLELLERHTTAHVPAATNLTFEPHEVNGRLVSHPYLLPRDAPGVRAAVKVLTDTFGRPPLFYRQGHHIPVLDVLWRVLGVRTTEFGFGVPDYQVQMKRDGGFRLAEQIDQAAHVRGRSAWVALLEELAVQERRCSFREAPEEGLPGGNAPRRDLCISQPGGAFRWEPVGSGCARYAHHTATDTATGERRYRAAGAAALGKELDEKRHTQMASLLLEDGKEGAVDPLGEEEAVAALRTGGEAGAGTCASQGNCTVSADSAGEPEPQAGLGVEDTARRKQERQSSSE